MSENLLNLLEYIDPSALSYQEWINIGMALKHEGYSVTDWDAWSMRDSARYHDGDCEKKWKTFNGSASPVTGGTIFQLAVENGYKPSKSENPLDWDSVIGAKDDLVIVDKSWIEGKEIVIPEKWNPVQQIIQYIETLFEAAETVGYVTETWEKDGKYLPTKGTFTQTAGEIIEKLSKCGDDIGAVLGDYKEDAGAWIRFNPLDGKGVKNENVTEYRYALVESDTVDLSHQNQILRELELPIACLVYSGGKSLHAIVRIEAADFTEYRKRVEYLYDVCKKNGLEVDRQNKNPSRLSRLPGIIRKGQKQYLLDTNIGKSSWNEWKEWIESVNDDLPDPESMAAVWDNLPELSPSLIDGILRQGHKMLLAGPSKAGKSFALIELCCSIAEGKPWFGFSCTEGKVLYVNLELDRASCLHRFKDVYTRLGWKPEKLGNIDIWNLRGKTIPMDKLAPKLIRRAYKKNYIAIVIDPIYKVITGDENSADQMAHFCNQFDKVCTELGCAVIYCHHHSKGAQGGKRSMDRASGSGVFARDPDALLDLIELPVNDALLQQQADKATCAICEKWLKRFGKEDEASPDDLCSERAMLDICRKHLMPDSFMRMNEEIEPVVQRILKRTAWRIEGTLREFPKFEPLNLWFEFPVHTVDTSGVLADVETEEQTPWNKTWKKNFTKKKSPEDRAKERSRSIEEAFGYCADNGKAEISDLAQYMGVSEKTVRSRLKEHGGYWIDEGIAGEK